MKRNTAGIVFVGLLLVIGCGQNADFEFEVAPVKGTVLLDGKPLDSGVVLVVPSGGRMARGAIQQDGSFELTTYEQGDGAQIGTHPVMVKPIAGREGQPASRSKLPLRYGSAQSGLSITVSADEPNTPVFELASK